MPYCTQNDIIDQISEAELTQITSENGDMVDANIVAGKIAEADSEIDSYLQKHYTIPLSPVPTVIRSASVKIALYHLYSRRAGRVGMDETVKDNYEKTIAWLKLVATKAVTIGAQEVPAASSSEPVKIKTNERQYTKSNLRNF